MQGAGVEKTEGQAPTLLIQERHVAGQGGASLLTEGETLQEETQSDGTASLVGHSFSSTRTAT